MYRLMIVDDEVTIVEGLCGVVDWKQLGFEVVHTAADGRDAIRFLQNSHVDAVLTDIKMTFMSGLDLARYISDNKLDTAVVIMSGYKEFELAREALMCHVKYYLLKPTNLGELRKVFLAIRDERDAEKKRSEMQETSQQQFSELLAIYQEQFFIDLIMGAVRTREAVDRRIRARMEIVPEECRLCVYSVVFAGESGSTENQGLKKHLLDTSLRGYNAPDSAVRYIATGSPTDYFQIVAVAMAQMDCDTLVKTSAAVLERIAQKIDAVLGIAMTVRRERTFDNLYDAAAYYKPMVPATDVQSTQVKDYIEPGDHSHLLRQKKLFLTSVGAGNAEAAENLFENFIDELRLMRIPVIQNFLIDLFASVKLRLEDLGLPIQPGLFDYHSIFLLREVEPVRQWGLGLLRRVFAYTDQYRGTIGNSAVATAKTFIHDHCHEDIGLEEVASHVFLSPIYFSHLFKQKTGENFVDYLIRMRMTRAMELLREPHLKIYEVSEKVGYRNTKYFYKLFKNFAGCTPAEYREHGSGKLAPE